MNIKLGFYLIKENPHHMKQYSSETKVNNLFVYIVTIPIRGFVMMIHVNFNWVFLLLRFQVVTLFVY